MDRSEQAGETGGDARAEEHSGSQGVRAQAEAEARATIARGALRWRRWHLARALKQGVALRRWVTATAVRAVEQAGTKAMLVEGAAAAKRALLSRGIRGFSAAGRARAEGRARALRWAEASSGDGDEGAWLVAHTRALKRFSPRAWFAEVGRDGMVVEWRRRRQLARCLVGMRRVVCQRGPLKEPEAVQLLRSE